MSKEITIVELREAIEASLCLLEMLPVPFNPNDYEMDARDLLISKLIVHLYHDDPIEGCRAMISLLQSTLKMGALYFAKSDNPS